MKKKRTKKRSSPRGSSRAVRSASPDELNSIAIQMANAPTAANAKKLKQRCLVRFCDSPILNVHPGELLREEFMKPFGLTAAKISQAIPRLEFEGTVLNASSFQLMIEDFMRADPDESWIGIVPALALDRFFGLSDGYWWRVQGTYLIRAGAARHAEWLSGVRALKFGRKAPTKRGRKRTEANVGRRMCGLNAAEVVVAGTQMRRASAAARLSGILRALTGIDSLRE